MAVFQCGKDVVGLYIGGQFVAALLAMSVFAFVSGLGPLNPWLAKKALNLSWPEAVYLWITGSPPSRLQKTGRENINDFAHAFSEFYASEGSEAPPRSKILDFERCFGVRKSAAVATVLFPAMHETALSHAVSLGGVRVYDSETLA
ncbi:hypothetical protein AK812_SmicGene4559 [Symbiodinium microadriaticum]|uniref:Uncharacterized protein n=1 Tax=Symbiodinium microadriaticum TaxID=2951 RepID=A0A1Q9EW77_SYMMI|nr:hypothetical protein AK812_SmicGene4559 [Symbiodinium microadriaticum]